MTLYICECRLGMTVGIKGGSNVILRTLYPNGEWSDTYDFSEIDNWSLERWLGQYDVEEVSSDEFWRRINAT